MFEKEPVSSGGASSLEASLATSRVIHVALMMGVVFFSGAAALGVAGRGANAPLGALSSSAWLMVAAVVIPVLVMPVAFAVRRSMFAKAMAAERPLEAIQGAMVVSGAFVEAVGLLGAMLWMLSGRPLPGAIVVVFSLLGLAALFPKRRDYATIADVERASATDGARFEPPETWS